MGGGGGCKTEENKNVQRFKALLVSPSQSKARTILASLRATPSANEARHLQQQEQEDDPTTSSNSSSTIDLAVAVREYLDVEDVGAWYEQLLFIPAYNSDLFRKDAPLTGVGTYSILLADPAQPSAPLHHLQYKAVIYDVLLEEFPPRSVVQVYAVRAAAPDDDAATAARPPQLLATATTDGEGQARLRQRFWPLVLPAGDYLFKAVDVASGAEGLSPLYSLSAAPQRRKLYGPVMWV